jgi:hypothetical protein
MNRNYVIYFCMKETCDVEFSLPYNSFNSAKDKIDEFLSEFCKKRGKTVKFVSKDEFEKIRLLKRPDDCLYVRRKNSEAVVYNVNVLTGTFYNTYNIEKYGKVGISEFFTQLQGNMDKVETETKMKDIHVTNYERGAHVSFVNELKNALIARDKRDKNIEVSGVSNNILKSSEQQAFISSLINGKLKLKKM